MGSQPKSREPNPLISTKMCTANSTFIFQEVYHKSMTLKEAIKSALTILKQVMEEKLSENNVEVVTMTPGSMFHMFTREQLAEVIKDIP